MAELPNLQWAQRDVDSVLAQLKQQLPEITNGEWNDMLDSDVGYAIIKTAAVLFNKTAYFFDQNLAEGYLSSCTTREAGVRLSKALGYIPDRAEAASVTVQVTNPVLPYDVNIPPNSKWLIDGKQFTCLQNIFIPAGQTVTIINLVQGSPYQVTVRAPGLPWFKVVVPTNSSNIVVTVGDAQWTAIDTWLDPPVRTSYKLYEDLTGQTICFGANQSTKMPLRGDLINVTAVITDGKAGNIEEKGLSATLITTILVRGSQVNQSLTGVTITAALGGTDVETLASIRKNAPGIYSTAGRAVTEEDYEEILKKTPGVRDSRVVGGQKVGRYGHVVITVCGDDPLNVSQDFLDFVEATIVKKNILTVTPVVQAPQIIHTYLSIEAGIEGTVFNPPTSSINSLSTSATSFFSELGIGESVYASQLSAVLEAITNVHYVNITSSLKSSAFSTSGLISIPLITNPDLTDATLTLDDDTVLLSGNLTSYNEGGTFKFVKESLQNNDVNVTLSYKPARIGDTINLLLLTNQLLVLNQATITSVAI